MDDRVLGYVLLVGSLLGIVCYFYLVFLSPWILLAIQVSAFIAVAAILAIMAWIGYTLVNTSRQTSLEEFEDFSTEEEEEEIA